MKLSDIIKHTQRILPKHTNYFSNVVNVDSLSYENGICTVITNTEHNLQSGDLINIEGAKVSNKIISLTQNHGLGTLVTELPHEVTKNSPLREGDSTHITIYNANEPEYNGTFLIMNIPNTNVIEFSIDSNAPLMATGNPEIKEEVFSSFNGRFNVKEIIDENTFTYELPNEPFKNIATGEIKITSGVRISGDYSLQNAIKAYTRQNRDDLWGFLVLDGSNVSKSRVNGTDAISEFLKGADLNIEAIQDLSFFVFVPTSDEYCWIDFVDICQELRKPILKTLHNARFESGVYDEDCYLSFVGDNPVDTDGTAFAIYQYKFQTTLNIYNEDGIEADFEPRLKKFEIYEKNNFNDSDDTIQFITEGDLPNEYINP